MDKEELKKKILTIVRGAMIEADELPFLETTDNIADALIAAGLTFDSEYKNLYEKEKVISQSLRGTSWQFKGWYEEQKHRAEVAERALDKATELAYTYRTQDDTLSCSSCPFDSIFDRCKERGLYEDCSKRWKEELLEQAEKELAEEKSEKRP